MKLANYNFSNSNQLKRYMDKMIREGLEYCAWRAENMLRKLLEERLYDFYDPKMYERTYELLNSISHSNIIKLNNGTYYVEIYYDTDKIRSYPRTSDGWTYKWGQHTSFNNEDVSSWIPTWIELGTNNGHYPHNGTHSMEDTKKWISKEYNRLFRLALKIKYVNNIE